jgi:hypothetical protein
MVSAFVDWIVQAWEKYVLEERGNTFTIRSASRGPERGWIWRPLRFRHSFAQKTTDLGRIA